MTKKSARSMSNPVLLKPVDKAADGILQVIIETPKGSRNKFAFDEKQKIFAVKKVLPAGMTFPYDFGFLPRTVAPDGDPIDVLLLMDEPAFPGIAVRARLIGIIEGEQTEGKKTTRNDRLLAVAEMNHEYAYLKKLDDLPKQFLHELEEFFVNYHRMEGKRYKLLGTKETNAAKRMIQKARRARLRIRSVTAEMGELLARFVIGGTVVSFFAVVAEMLRPKTFAGLFGAAPSVALATLGITIAKHGISYAATEAHFMIFGAIAFCAYAFAASWMLRRYRPPALVATTMLLPIWFAGSFALWWVAR